MKYFGTDGIRGVFPDFLSPKVAYKLGLALTKYFAENENKVILIANDGRVSGNCLETALASGILAGGFDVEFLGVMSSCGLAYLTKDVKAAAGVMVSASHNPPEYNGLKVFNNNAEKLLDKEEREVEKLMQAETSGEIQKCGKLHIKHNIKNKYIKFLRGLIKNSSKPFVKNICVGAGYGGASEICRKVFEKQNVNVHFFACDASGEKINSEYSAVSLEKMQEAVIKTKSDFGFCLDGDADRIIAVDEKGEIVDGDKMVFILAKFLKAKKVVGTNFANTGIKQALKANGIKFLSTQVGDKFVIEKLKKIKGELGGEKSGHIIMPKYLNTGDGVLTAVMLLNAIEYYKKPLSGLANDFKPFIYKTVNIRVTPAFKKKFKNNKEFKSFKKECEELLISSGRVVVRESGTEPVIRILVEGLDEGLCNKVLEIVKNKIIELDSKG